jgi:hypothetical protein
MLVVSGVVWWFDITYSIRNPPPPLELPPKEAPKRPPKTKPPPPVRLDNAMVLLAPVALALQEGAGAVIAKCLTQITFNQGWVGGAYSEKVVVSPFYCIAAGPRSQNAA